MFSADGIVKQGLDSQLFLSYENESTRVRNLYGLSLYEKMVNDDPQAFINLLFFFRARVSNPLLIFSFS